MTNTMLTLLSASKIREFYVAGFWRDETIYALARRNAEQRFDKIAIRESSRQMSYRDLIAAADRLAIDLHESGLRFGQRVAVWLPSRIETAVALLACSRHGYVCCPSLHRDHTVAEIVELLERMRAAALITQSAYGADAGRHDIFSAAEQVPSLQRVYRLGPADGGIGDLGSPMQPSGAAIPPRSDPDTIVYLAFTSGTTGVPKGVMHSDNTLLANARVLSADWQLGADAVIYSMSPLSHNLGFGAMVMALANGSELVLHDVPKGRSTADRIIETKSTFIFGVPTHAIDLLAELRARGLKGLGSVKGFRISGAAISPAVATQLLDYNILPQSGYGMTEACSHHYTLPGDGTKLIVETSGKACAGYEAKIFSRDDPDLELPAGEIGQIGGRGASLMLGYFDDQATTEDSFNSSGWFMTGDLGWMDENAYLRITGRKKDLIVRGGHNIYPARIEALAMRHEAVERAAAIPVKDDRLGEKVCLAVTLRSGNVVSAYEMLEHLDSVGLSKFDMPEYFIALDNLPLTASGKILKRELVSWVEQGRVMPMPVRWTSRNK